MFSLGTYWLKRIRHVGDLGYFLYSREVWGFFGWSESRLYIFIKKIEKKLY